MGCAGEDLAEWFDSHRQYKTPQKITVMKFGKCAPQSKLQAVPQNFRVCDFFWGRAVSTVRKKTDFLFTGMLLNVNIACGHKVPNKDILCTCCRQIPLKLRH